MVTEPTQADAPPGAAKILVAEDEVLLRLMVADALRREGFQVFEASDAGEAIAILEAVRVDVVVTDLHMRATGDGMEVAKCVRARRPGVPVILASAHPPPIDGTHAFDAFFVKPFPPEDIASWIRHWAKTVPDDVGSSLE